MDMQNSSSEALKMPPIEKSFSSSPQIFLAGNPNVGKTMLFNCLAKQNAKVANFPGVSVEIRRAHLILPLVGSCQLIDLPGTYSLYARSEDEQVAALSLLRSCSQGSKDIILAVLDATNLERNLYFLSQLIELGKPIVAALTMMDLVQAQKQCIDLKKLSELSGVPVVAVSSVTGAGLEELKKVLDEFIMQPRNPKEIDALAQVEKRHSTQIFSEKGAIYTQHFAFSPKKNASYGLLAYFDDPAQQSAAGENEKLSWPAELSDAVALSIAERYERVSEWSSACLKKMKPRKDLTARLDAFLLHPISGPLVLIFIFSSMFGLLFKWLDPVVGVIESICEFLANSIHSYFAPDSLLASLLAEGVVAGIGSVLAFVPLIAALFLFLGILEDSGYLARATFLLDRVMRKVGLSGKAFIPLLSGFACAVPAIMSTRVIESRSSRLITILVTPLMSCSARLPIYGLLIASLFASTPPIFGVINSAAAVMMFMYSLGLICAFLVAWALRKYLFKTTPASLILELPSYHMPRISSLLRTVYSRIAIFLREVGTVILAMSIIMWALFSFPRSEAVSDPYATGVLKTTTSSPEIADSYAGQLGRAMQPIIEPLGFDWKIGVGILASFAAREVFVSTLGVIYGLGNGSDSDNSSLREAIRNDINPQTNKPVFTPLVGLSLMVFFALAMQCMSTLVATRRETGNWGWPLLQLSYMSVLAWGSSFLVFQLGCLLGFG